MVVWARLSNRRSAFVTLVAMFIHRNINTGLGDRGAWPWRRPFVVCG